MLSDSQSHGCNNPALHDSKWLPKLLSSQPLSNRRMEEGTQKSVLICLKDGGHIQHAAYLFLAPWAHLKVKR